MQSLSAFLPLAQTTAGSGVVDQLVEQARQQQHMSIGMALLLLLAGQLVLIISYFISSKAVAEAYRSTFLNAVRVWILHWLLVVGTAVCLAVALLALHAAQQPDFVLPSIGLLLLIALVMWVRIPMDVYHFSVLRGIGFLLLAWIISTASGIGVSYAFDKNYERNWQFISTLAQLTPEQRREVTTRVWNEQKINTLAAAPLSGESEAKDPSRPLPERAEALKRMYADLEARRHAVNPNDETAKLVYERQKKRYEEVLGQLKAEAARQRR